MNNNIGNFGQFGGRYVPETLMSALLELDGFYNDLKDDSQFNTELKCLLKDYAGRATPLYYAKRLTEELGGGKVYFKREDLNHTGSHKLNNVLGQILIAKAMGKKRVIAETGAGQHGVATATGAAIFGMECHVYMGEEDIQRQKLNVFRMKLLGAEVVSVVSGTCTLKDATNEALRDWVANVDNTYYVIGSVVGPHPYPTLVRDFQSVIGTEIKQQIMEKEGRLPDYLIACVGGGSNAIGMFYPFIEDKSVRKIGVEAAGKGLDTEEHAATITKGSIGVFHGMKTYLLQNQWGNIKPVHSISAGLDYPGVGPEHSFFHETGQVEYRAVTDTEAVSAFNKLSRTEGIIPALESSHAVAYALKRVPQTNKEDIIIVNMSGRGDKDVYSVAEHMGVNVE